MEDNYDKLEENLYFPKIHTIENTYKLDNGKELLVRYNFKDLQYADDAVYGKLSIIIYESLGEDKKGKSIFEHTLEDKVKIGPYENISTKEEKLANKFHIAYQREIDKKKVSPEKYILSEETFENTLKDLYRDMEHYLENYRERHYQ